MLKHEMPSLLANLCGLRLTIKLQLAWGLVTMKIVYLKHPHSRVRQDAEAI